MTNSRIVLGAIASGAMFFSATAIATGEPGFNFGSQWAEPAPAAQPYGIDGTVDELELNVLFHLSFPQSYEAMKNRLGFPAYRDPNFDYYRIAGTQHWVSVEYDGETALGYHVGD